TSEPRVGVSVRGPIASARRGRQVDAQEAFGLWQVFVREHKGHTSVVGQACVRGRHASGLLDNAGKSAGIAARLVVVRDLEIWLDVVRSRLEDGLRFSFGPFPPVLWGQESST